jgi:hypothetical protein
MVLWGGAVILLVWGAAVILFLVIMNTPINQTTSFVVANNLFASDVFQWPCSQYGKWGMKRMPVQGGQEGNVHPPTDRVDLYVDNVCHIRCTIAHDGHIHLLRVLPHTTF